MYMRGTMHVHAHSTRSRPHTPSHAVHEVPLCTPVAALHKDPLCTNSPLYRNDLLYIRPALHEAIPADRPRDWTHVTLLFIDGNGSVGSCPSQAVGRQEQSARLRTDCT